MNISNVKPPLKWVGGKRQLLEDIYNFLPQKESIDTYYEPFVGGGALLFDFQPLKAVINDTNGELINFYKVVKNNVDELIEMLKTYENEEELFYKVRAMDRDESFKDVDDITKASRMHFLNKTCYNGLYRVNMSGEFNSPFGRYKNPDIVNEKTLRAVSEYFNKADIKLLNKDFEKALDLAKEGDFVYLDPPYDPISESASFTGYTKSGFGKEEQERVFNVCKELNNKGVKFLLSNSSTDFILNLYKDFDINLVYAKRSINSKGTGRGNVKEVLVKNYD